MCNDLAIEHLARLPRDSPLQSWMNKLLICVAVFLLIILVFNIVSLASLDSGWFRRSTAQPSQGLDGTNRYLVATTLHFGTLGYCAEEYNGTNHGARTDLGCHDYNNLLSPREDEPADFAVRGMIRAGRVGLAFSVLGMASALFALVLCILGALGIVGLGLVILGVVLTVLNLIFCILAWSVMLGLHSDGKIGSLICGLSDVGLDYAWVLSLVASILGLVAAPLFLIGAMFASLFGGAVDSDEDMLTYQRPQNDGVPYTLMQQEGLAMKQM